MRVTRADLIVVAAVALATASLYPAIWGPRGAGDTALVRVPGAPDTLLSLAEDRQVTFHGPLGDSTVEVRDGKIRFTHSPCDGKQCIHSGWLQNAGDFAACLPNRVSVTVAGAHDFYDAINF